VSVSIYGMQVKQAAALRAATGAEIYPQG